MTTTDESPDIFGQWLAEERERRLELFYAKRDPVFAEKGTLDPRVHAWLETVVTRKAGTLLLGGPTGTGKTWTAWKAIQTLVYNGWRGGWDVINAYELHQLMAPPVDQEELNRLARLDLLVVDDLASVGVTDWTAGHLLGLMDHRWRKKLPTIITTNVKKLGDVIGDRIASRLADGATSIALEGLDRRRAN
jgi:DNA replication protein DnaC